MVTPNNFGFGGGEMRSKESRKEEGKDRKGALSTQGMKENLFNLNAIILSDMQ